MTEEQQRIVQQLVTRFHEMRRIGHHDGAILAAMIQEGHARGAVEEVRKAVQDGLQEKCSWPDCDCMSGMRPLGYCVKEELPEPGHPWPHRDSPE